MIPTPVVGGTIGYAVGCIVLLLVLKVGQVGSGLMKVQV